MVKITFFQNKHLITYSKLLHDIRLNSVLVDNAQQKIYSMNMADKSNLTSIEKIQSVLNALTIPKIDTSDYELFKMAFALALTRSQEMKTSLYADFRLTTSNFEKVSTLLGMISEPENNPKQKPLSEIEKISMVINAIFVMFDTYDVENNRMSIYLGQIK